MSRWKWVVVLCAQAVLGCGTGDYSEGTAIAEEETFLPCATETPSEYFTLTSADSTSRELHDALSSLGYADVLDSPEWKSVQQTIELLGKKRAEWSIQMERAVELETQLRRQVEEFGSDSAQVRKTAVQAKALKETLEELRSSLGLLNEQFSYGLDERFRFVPTDRRLRLMFIRRGAEKFEVVPASSEAGRAVQAILENELEWEPASTGGTTHGPGFEVEVTDKYSSSDPPIVVRLNSGSNQASVRKGAKLATEDVADVGKIGYQVRLSSSPKDFEEYFLGVIAAGLKEEKEAAWVVSTKGFAIKKHNLIHEVCHVLGMLHELQAPRGTGSLRSYQKAVDNGLLLLAPEWKDQGGKYKSQILSPPDECKTHNQAVTSTAMDVCRYSSLDQDSIMCYWLPVSVLPDGKCEDKGPASVECTKGGKPSKPFLGWSPREVPRPGKWLTLTDREFLSK